MHVELYESTFPLILVILVSHLFYLYPRFQYYSFSNLSFVFLSISIFPPPVTIYMHIYNDENDPVLYQASSLYQVNRN
jgi:hypothetical protein